MSATYMDRLNELRGKKLDLMNRQQSCEGTCEYEDLQYRINCLEDSIEQQHRVMEQQAAVVSVRQDNKKKVKKPQLQLYHLTLALLDKYNFVTFNKLMEKIATSEYVATGGFVYVYEQCGIDRATRGDKIHAHIRFKSTLTKGRLLYRLKRASGLDNSAIKLVAHSNGNALRMYMLGHKGDPANATDDEQRRKLVVKQQRSVQDKIWRVEQQLKTEYVL